MQVGMGIFINGTTAEAEEEELPTPPEGHTFLLVNGVPLKVNGVYQYVRI